MIAFYILFGLIILQRLIELLVARHNEKKLKAMGAYEVGKRHYRWIVACHSLFLIALFIEVIVYHSTPASWWWIPGLIFVFAQLVRVWAIASLGAFWNTKIIILPGAQVIKKGPYRFVRHPNYLIVMTEIIMIPIIFQAYFTAVIFTIFNVIVLSIRIPIEENALKSATNYSESLGSHHRFIP